MCSRETLIIKTQSMVRNSRICMITLPKSGSKINIQSSHQDLTKIWPNFVCLPSSQSIFLTSKSMLLPISFSVFHVYVAKAHSKRFYSIKFCVHSSKKWRSYFLCNSSHITRNPATGMRRLFRVMTNTFPATAVVLIPWLVRC
jgi:hypothetical protein